MATDQPFEQGMTIYIFIYREVLTISSDYAWVYEILQKSVVKSWQFMRHGHEMLWFLRGSFSESELPLSYNAHSSDTRIQLLGYEINFLNKV